MNDPRSYYMSDELDRLLHGIPAPLPPPVVEKLIPKHTHREGQEWLRTHTRTHDMWGNPLAIPVEFMDYVPSQCDNAGNNTFSTHTLHGLTKRGDMHVTQSDNRFQGLSWIDRDLANYLHPIH